MSKELIRPGQFAKAEAALDLDLLTLSQDQQDELTELFSGTLERYKQGTILTGNVIKTSSEGVLVDINYKSDGLIPLYEFTEHELKKLTPGTPLEVILDELENFDGNVMLSYEKAKAMKAWDAILKLFEEGKPTEGVVTHKVKGGLSVDIGIPAFLPGSQVDVQRVTNFDQFVGQTISAHIIKVNQKRGNVILSRRKFLHEQRSELRKGVLDTLSQGQVIQGAVKNITNYGVFIDIGGVDGLLHITDMAWRRISHPSELVKIGDNVTVKVLSFDKTTEQISLGMKQLTDNPWQALASEVQVNSRITGTISNITSFGLLVEVQPGIEGLVHISEISWTDRITDLHKFYKTGQSIEVLVVSLDKESRRMSLSVKQLEKNPWETISEQYQTGQNISGKIINVTEFGIFVQIAPGIDGLVHISDFSWTEHIEHPADRYQKGQEVEAVIIGIKPQNQQISLGIKQLTPNPWEEIEKKFPVGSIVEGEVSKITNFGAFIKLPNGIEGLVHISELSSNGVDKVEDVLKVGQKTEFKVIKVSQEEHKLGLSLKTSDSEEPKEKPAKKTSPKEKPARSKEKHDSRTPQKSQLQVELEKHAARQQSGDEENN